MAYTIQQKRLVDRVADILVSSRRQIRNSCVGIKAELDAYTCPELSLAKVQSAASTLGNMLDQLQGDQAEIVAAATLVGVSDFAIRWTELNDARVALVAATAVDIGAKLQAVIDGLPAETVY